MDVAALHQVRPERCERQGACIASALGVDRLDPSWTLPSLLEANPPVWMAEGDGLPVYLRAMPREAQGIASERGMIPCIPADRGRASGRRRNRPRADALVGWRVSPVTRP